MTNLARILIKHENVIDTVFSHGENLRGEHVDCIGEIENIPYVNQGDFYFTFVREATQEEIDKYCLEE